MTLTLFCLLTNILVIHCLGHDLSFQKEIAEGKSRLNDFLQKSYGDCWTDAISKLQDGCKNLNQETQSRLAISFTNCFLEYNGKKSCSCPNEILISDCLHNSSDVTFTTYTEFYTHTQSICHYLQHQEWEKQTQKTIQSLSETSHMVSKKIDESSKMQSRILNMQHTAWINQIKMISDGQSLNNELQKSRDNAKTIYEDFKSNTNEQKLLIFEIFDRVKGLQNLVLGEFNTVYTVVYYVAGIFLCYVVTSLPQTANARLCLIMILTGTAFMERYFAEYFMENDVRSLFPSQGPTYSRLWLLRKATCAICIFVLWYTYYFYKDFASMNNQLLRDIQKQNIELYALISTNMNKLNSAERESVIRKLPLYTSVDFNTPQVKELLPTSSSVASGTPARPAEIKSKTPPPNITSSSAKNKSLIKYSRERVAEKKNESRRTDLNASIENTTLMSIENKNQALSGSKRYNLRSRTNSPTLSPAISSPVNPLSPLTLRF